MKEITEILQGIENAIVRNHIGSTVDTPGIMEQGFMRLHENQQELSSELSDIRFQLSMCEMSLDQIATNSTTIARALTIMADRGNRDDMIRELI